MNKYYATVTVEIEAETESEAVQLASDIFDNCEFNYREDTLTGSIELQRETARNVIAEGCRIDEQREQEGAL